MVSPGEIVEGSFTVFGPEKAPVFGSLTATDLRMEILTPEFSGSPYEVSYRFDAKGLSQGDTLKGDFRIISNQGEYVLPFVVTVRVESISSSLGDIKNLFHFANLAKTDWDEAVSLFYSDAFINIFKGNDAQHESLYRGLSISPGSQQNVEEFLISINKKHPVQFMFDQEEMNLEYRGTTTEHSICVTRSGWGYTYLKMESVGDFIHLGKQEIAEEDFKSNTVRVRVHILPERLHEGRNFGRIVCYNAFTRYEIPVTVSVELSERHLAADYQEMKKLTVELVRTYENFSCKKITPRAWLTETGKVISRMNAIDDKSLEVRLYTAHYNITAGRINEGKWILDKLKREVEEEKGDTLYSYYLYLSTLCSKEESFINDISERLEGIFRRNRENWRIAWILQYVSEEFSTAGPRKWMMLEEQFSYGCRSPILYLEAMNLLNDTPSILTKLDKYELYVLEYGARRKILSLNLIDQMVYLSLRARNFDKRLFNILVAAMEIKENNDVLEAIVSLLIKGGKTDKGSFEWYKKGVENQLRITRLYEYYMMSIYTDEEGRLPCDINRMVLMYFSYQSDLEYDKNAILYRYIHEHRQDYPELYESYVPQIEKFMMAQLDKGRTSRNLGYLYKNLLTKQMVDASNASKVLSILYTSEIRTSDKRATGVCVVYDKCEGEMRYPIVDGCAYVPLYGSDYAVFLTDSDDNRYAASIPYTNTKLMLPGKLAGYAIPYIQKGKENLDLFLCDLGKNAYNIDLDNVVRYRDLAESDMVRAACREEIRNNLIRFYYDNDFTRQLTEFMQDIDPRELGTRKRNETIDILTMAGLYDKALQWVKQYGTYGLDPKVALRMCSRLLDRGTLESGAKELEIAHYAFRNGKYDEQVLMYLVAGFNGTVKEMRDIWRSAESFGLDTYALSERMLIQMLYSGSYIGEKIEVFKSYVQNGANTNIELAFISQSSYDSFVHGSITDKFIYDRIEKMALDHVPLLEVCGLAYLRYYATEKKQGEQYNEEVAVAFLKGLFSRNIYFPFFSEYEGLIPDIAWFIDKTMLEYRTTPGTHCFVHYRFDSDAGGEYRTMELKEMYDGIYVCHFVVFFGEKMQYYITEQGSEDGTVTESGTIQRNDIMSGQHTGRYSLINDIMIGETLQDYDTVDALIGEYYKKRFICDSLFSPLGDDTKVEG